MIFDSMAATEDERKICLAWVMGLPHPKGLFGFEEETTIVPSFSVTPKGGTVGGSLEDFCTKQLYSAYPNMAPEWEIDYDVPQGCEPVLRAHILDVGHVRIDGDHRARTICDCRPITRPLPIECAAVDKAAVAAMRQPPLQDEAGDDRIEQNLSLGLAA